MAAIVQTQAGARQRATCSCGIDIHAHVVPAEFPRSLRSPGPADWPSMAAAQDCHRHVMIAGKVYRTVSDRCWDVPKRIRDMDEMGLSLQAISPMPELLSYWMDARDGFDLLRYINDQMAEMVAASAGRLVALGGVPMQDLELAVREMQRVQQLGFRGVEIGSNVNGKPVGHPDLDAFFAAAESLGMAVFVHALRPTGMDRLVGPKNLQQVLAYPTDVGLAASSVICSNLVLRHPGLRIAFSHGGGTLSSLLPRLEQGWRTFPALREAIQVSPSEQARRLYYDALVFDPTALQRLLAVFGSDRIMLGTDYPFAFRDDRPAARICEAVTDFAIQEQLLHANARKWLGAE